MEAKDLAQLVVDVIAFEIDYEKRQQPVSQSAINALERTLAHINASTLVVLMGEEDDKAKRS